MALTVALKLERMSRYGLNVHFRGDFVSVDRCKKVEEDFVLVAGEIIDLAQIERCRGHTYYEYCQRHR